MRPTALALVLAPIAAAGCVSVTATHHAAHSPAPPDGRVEVAFPEALRTHTLANMRDHLAALQEIQQALATRCRIPGCGGPTDTARNP